MLRDDLEGLDQWGEVNLRWHMLVPYSDYGPAFRAFITGKLITVPNCADVAGIWVEQIDRPILRFSTVVSKWSRDFEFDSPPVGDEEVRASLRLNSRAIFWDSI
jgi:hypothetical protein